MAKKNGSQGTRNGLEQAMILLIQNQAAFQSQLTAVNERMDKRSARIDERFERIENDLTAIKGLLMRHEQLLEALPEAIRQKIGFEKRH